MSPNERNSSEDQKGIRSSKKNKNKNKGNTQGGRGFCQNLTLFSGNSVNF